MIKSKTKSLNAAWYGARLRLKLDAKIIFPFRLDIPDTRKYNECRAIISVSDLSWKKRPVDLVGVQKSLIRISRSNAHHDVNFVYNLPMFIYYDGQESDFYFIYDWDEEHFKLITVTPTQDLYDDNGKLAHVYRFGLDR